MEISNVHYIYDKVQFIVIPIVAQDQQVNVTP